MEKYLTRHKLGDLIDATRGQSLSGEYYSDKGDYIRLTLANFDYQNGGFKLDAQKDDLYYTGNVKEQFLLNEGDIITPLTEQALGLLGSTARIPESGKYVQSGDIALLKCKNDLLDPDYLYYLLPSASVKKQLAACAQQTKIRHSSPDAIKNCIVDIPNKSEQKKIANFLNSIDRKISVNREINETLESMAKQLYDYWFVQFDFPNAEGKPYKSSGGKMVYNETLKREIPKGWEVVPIGSILDSYSTTRKLESKEYLKTGEYPIIDQGSEYVVGWTNDKDAVLDRYPAILFGDHSTVVKFINFPFVRGADGTQILYSNNANIDQYYFYQYVKSLPIPNPGYSRHFKFLKEMPIIVPNGELTSKYKDLVKIPFDLWSYNIKTNFDLTALRDYLLPLLMNGQVKIN